jgi:hypothetical protein
LMAAHDRNRWRGQTLSRVAAARAHEICAEEWRGRPATSAGGRWRVRQARVHGKVVGGEWEDGARARDGGGQRDRVRLEMAAPNRYDRRYPRFCIASDEPTAEKNECRSNRRCN